MSAEQNLKEITMAKRAKNQIGILIFLLLFTSCAHVIKQKAKAEAGEPEFSTFAVSTEMEIGKAWPIIEKAPKGVFISVGSERSFRGFSMDKNATALYVLDISPKVLRFATINRELFLAPDLQAYRNLRFDSDFSAWQRLQNGRKVEHLLSQDDFSWWQNNVRDVYVKDRYNLPEMLNRYETDTNYQEYIKFYKGFKNLFTKVGPKEQQEIAKIILKEPLENIKKRLTKANIKLPFSLDELQAWRERGKDECYDQYLKHPGFACDVASIINFKLGNYLFDEVLYKRLHKAAVNKKIFIYQVNLAEDAELLLFLDKIKAAKENISVLDLDNTYFQDYIGDPKYMKIVNAFSQFSTDNSILLAMSNISEFMCTQFQSYFGFRYSLIRSLESSFPFGSYIESLPGKIVAHMDQKLYDLNNLPPYWPTWPELLPEKF